MTFLRQAQKGPRGLKREMMTQLIQRAMKREDGKIKPVSEDSLLAVASNQSCQ